jgi:hypothetical protein
MGTYTLKKYRDILPDDEVEIEIEERETKKYKNIVQAYGISWNRD